MPFVVVIAALVATSVLLVVSAPNALASLGLLRFGLMPIDMSTPGAQITQRFSPTGHNALDIGAPLGTPCVCVAPGVVLSVVDSIDTNAGRHIIVRGRLPFSPTIGWSYSHLSRIDVTVGQELDTGDVIGLVGNSGRTTGGGFTVNNRTDGRGAHLHFAVLDILRGFKSIDPAPFLAGVS